MTGWPDLRRTARVTLVAAARHLGIGSLAGLGESGAPEEHDGGRQNLLLLVQLRWIAVAGQVVTIAVAQAGLGIALPLGAMAVVLAGLVLLNLVSLGWIARGGGVTAEVLFMALLLDVVALTLQLSLSGGATNPFTSLFLLQLTLAAVLLSSRATIGLVAITTAALGVLMLAYRPLVLPPGDSDELFRLYLVGMLVSFVIDAALIAVFVTRISRNLRRQDARLADLRQRAAEEDHIVRMGLLASGAAHELGTPLSSLSVILGDWRRMPELTASPDIAREIEEMQEAVGRCKAIVTGILLAAGAARGEAPHLTTVRGFVTELVGDWRRMRSCFCLQVRDEFGDDQEIVSDTALKQVLFNVLDNALDLSPNFVELVLSRDGDTLRLSVTDRGPGFAPEMLARLGQPYTSSKGRLGGGLGLFLVVNVVRKLGGTVEARNRSYGGAVVTISLPLSSLTV
ncbi:two-component system, sensor histidine kinase RegB [Methylobacterium sp. 174MFSha1.1]|uniref:ATP-binding protein n=1 Tax=Methylobacterium sp. 174MFSha1.1 TaxID=1502749 RepID=UPI0008F27DD7|nr:ATP-binding protein [Methylobacterium sp. 174MFSha1.1]SFU97194.1 two-component system, sensor histidine kinase RegB [Methylobacterium sp. 174MFSha1.1]